MTVVKYPVLLYKNSLTAFLNFASEYNSDKPLREQLRPTHAKLFARILTLLSRQIYEHNRLFQDTPEFRKINTQEPVKLQTNRKALSWIENTLKINENTVYRQLNRMIDAGVISEKINHGSQMNFELLINPEILLISDLTNPDYKPTSKNLETENKAIPKDLNTSFSPEYLIPEKEHFNNLNITVDKESRTIVRDDIGKEQERTSKKNVFKEHREIVQNNSENSERSSKLIADWNLSAGQAGTKEQQLAPPPESKLREHQKAAARWFFWYVLSRLFEGRSFNPAHLENTLAYVEQYYFINCYSLNAIESTRKLYKWRIDKAKRTVERHETNLKWIFPGHYLDLNRKGSNPKTGKPYMSFANTASWPKKFENLLKLKKEFEEKTKDQDLLNKQLSLFLKNSNINQFRRCEAFVKKNIPHLMNDFLSHFTTEKLQANA